MQVGGISKNSNRMIAQPKLTVSRLRDILGMLDGNIDLMTDDELTSYIDQIAIGIPFQMLELKKGVLYRARPNEGSRFFTNTSELWYPPLNCLRCNRFNDGKIQMLYVGESKSTVIEEVKPPPGSILTMITYEVIAPIKALPIGILQGVTKTNLFTPGYWQQLFQGKIKIYSGNPNFIIIDRLVNEFVYKYVTRENSTEDPREYRFTNIYGKHFLKAPIDGILYPSVSRKLFDINMALKIGTTKKLRIIQVEILKMDNKIQGQFELIAGSNQFMSNGEIIYNNKFGAFDGMKRVIK
jgi:hypothetical protein